MTRAERIKRARIAAKLKKADVARHFGVAKTTAARWEETTDTAPEGSDPGPTRLAQLAELLGVTPAYLAFGETARVASPEPTGDAA